MRFVRKRSAAVPAPTSLGRPILAGTTAVGAIEVNFADGAAFG